MSNQNITDEDKKHMQQAASDVWDYIAADCLESVAQDKGKKVYAVKMSKRDVIETVLDAGRTDELLKRRNQWTPAMASMSYIDQIRAVRPIFKSNYYGI